MNSVGAISVLSVPEVNAAHTFFSPAMKPILFYPGLVSLLGVTQRKPEETKPVLDEKGRDRLLTKVNAIDALAGGRHFKDGIWSKL